MHSKINIPKPCSENWDLMTPTEQGRHCEKCVKTVHDVSFLTNEEVEEKYIENNGQLCVRVQSERVIHDPNPQKSLLKRLTYGVAATLAFFWLFIKNTVAQAQSDSTSTQEEPNDSISTNVKSFSKILLRGYVRDSLENTEGVAFASVIVSKDSNQIGYTVTNVEGMFVLELGGPFLSTDTLLLQIVSIGMKTVTQKFNPKDTIPVDVHMKEENVCLGTTEIIGRKRTFTGVVMGVLYWPNGKKRIVKRPLLDEYDTKTYHHDDLERLNLGR